MTEARPEPNHRNVLDQTKFAYLASSLDPKGAYESMFRFYQGKGLDTEYTVASVLEEAQASLKATKGKELGSRHLRKAMDGYSGDFKRALAEIKIADYIEFLEANGAKLPTLKRVVGEYAGRKYSELLEAASAEDAPDPLKAIALVFGEAQKYVFGEDGALRHGIASDRLKRADKSLEALLTPSA